VIVDADVLSEDGAAPAVMISRDHQNRGAALPQVGQRGENAKAGSRYDCSPLEPELEQVAVHDEGRCPALKVPQEMQRFTLHGAIREAEMKVGDDVRRWDEHALILARREPLYKQTRAQRSSQQRLLS